jgi:integrase/recombinase XerD
MDVLLEQYQERLRRLGRHKSTIVSFTNAARRYQDFLDGLGIRAEDAEGWAVEEFFAGLSLAPSTKVLYLSEIRAAYRYARARKQMTHDPLVDVQLPRVPDSEPIVIPNPELRVIKARLVTDRETLIFHLLAYAGLRRGEVLGLSAEDVSLREQTLRIHGKGGKIRYVPIHPALGEQLATVELAPGCHVVRTKCRAVSDNTLEADLARISPGRTSHSFRRTVATSLARNGVDERIIDKIMGWAPRTVRARYYVNVATEEMQRGILRLYADDPV